MTTGFRLNANGFRMKLALIFASVILYVAAFPQLYSLRGLGALPVSAIPVIVIASTMGMRAGILAGVLVLPLNTLLINLVGETGWDVVFRSGGGFGSFAAVLVGAFVGRLHDLSHQLKHELAEHKLIEAALRASEARFRIVTESSLAGVYIIQNGVFVYVNPTFARIFAYQPHEMINRMGMPEITHAESRDETPPGEGDSMQYVFQGMCKNGTIVHCEVLGRHLEYQGRPAIMGTLLDISERKRVQEELLKAERLQAELEKEKELNELKSRFVSMISHEFRNPLAIISSSTQLLQRYHERLPETKLCSYYNQIQTNVVRLDGLLDDTLTINKAESVGLEFHPIQLDIEAFCRELVEENMLACNGSHTIIFTKTGTCDLVDADPNLLRRAVSNLLSNAIKYSPANSKIFVTLTCEASEVMISVRDGGIGIPMEDQKRLFEAYHRAKNVGNMPGTGLGLAIVKHVVETHHGSVDVISEEGVGTSFIISLPVSQTV